MSHRKSKRGTTPSDRKAHLVDLDSEDEATCPTSFHVEPEERRTNNRTALRPGPGPSARSQSPPSDEGPPSSDEFSDEGVSFEKAAPAATVTSGLGQGQQAEDSTGMQGGGFGAIGQIGGAPLSGDGGGEAPSLDENEHEGLGSGVPTLPAVDDDEGISFGPPHVPAPSQQDSSTGVPSTEDDEGVGLETSAAPSTSPQVNVTEVQSNEGDEDEAVAFAPPPTPRPAHVSLNQVSHRQPADAHLCHEPASEAPQARPLNPIDMTDEEPPPYTSLPEPILATLRQARPIRSLSSGTSPLVVNVRELNTSEEAQRGRDRAMDPEEEPDEEMFSRPTPVPTTDDQDDEDEVVPGSPSPTAMELVRNVSLARTQRIVGAFRARPVMMERSRRQSSPATLPSIRATNNEAVDFEEPTAEPTSIARNHIVLLERVPSRSEFYRTSTVATEPSSLLSDRPYMRLWNTRCRRASEFAA